MAIKDIRSQIQPRLAMDAAISTDTTTNGSAIDTREFELGLTFAVFAQAYSAGNYEIQLQEADDSAFTTNAATLTGDKLIGSFTDITAALAAGAIVQNVGVISNRRYVRVRIVSTSTGTATIVAVVLQKGELQPVATS